MLHRKESQIQSKNLLLLPLSIDEKDSLVSEETDPEMIDACAKMLAGNSSDSDQPLFHTIWGIQKKTEPQTRVGYACFLGSPQCGAVKINFRIFNPYCGNGYATEAVNGLISWAFHQDDVYTIEADVKDCNSAAQHVVRKIGFLPNGTRGEDSQCYSLERPSSNWFRLYLLLGLLSSALLGILLGHFFLCIFIGVIAGSLIGCLMDIMEKKHREKVKAPQNSGNNSI